MPLHFKGLTQSATTDEQEIPCSEYCADVFSVVRALAEDNLPQLQRCNSTPDLLDDVTHEVTSPNADDFRSLRDAMVTTKQGRSDESPSGGRSTNLLTSRALLGGSTGNLVDTPRKTPASSTAKPPPPVRGVSTLTGYDDPQRNRKRGSAGDVLESAQRDSHAHHYQIPPSAGQRNGGQTTMVRQGSTENLLSSPMNRQQRLPSEDLPPPPSPATFADIHRTSAANSAGSRVRTVDFVSSWHPGCDRR